MKYSIVADVRRWPDYQMPLSIPVSTANSIDWNGDIKIDFSFEGKGSTYELSNISIPLFLTELNLFLSSLRREFECTWNMVFSPFAYGRMVSKGLLISSRQGGKFNDGVYDLTTVSELNDIVLMLKADTKRYGILKTLELR